MKTFNELRDQISIELEKLNWQNEPRGLYEPIAYELSIGGKRVRQYRDWETDRKSTRLNSSHITRSRMPSSA